MTISFDMVAVEAADVLSKMQALSFQDGPEQVWAPQEMALLLRSAGVMAMVMLSKKSSEGVPMGFILWRELLEEAEILSLCILPKFRKQGRGHEILQALSLRAEQHGIKEIFLEVREDNQAALSLYEKNDFKLVGRRKNYYGPPDAANHGEDITSGGMTDALIMKYSCDQGCGQGA